MEKISRIYLYILALPKTILFNLRYLPFKQAIRLPVFISHRVYLMDLSGAVKISDTRTGTIKIGFGQVGIFDQHRSRTIWQVSGTVEFKGRASIGHGSKLSVSGNLSLGKNFCISAESTIIVKKSISIGDDVLISWDALIMDTDFHNIYNAAGEQTNPSMSIKIGNKVWVGCRTLILKGVHIADGSVLAAASTIVKSIETPNAIIGGNPAKVLKQDITWQP